MQKTAIIVSGESGRATADTLLHELNAIEIARGEVGKQWHDCRQFIFVGAMGICVRTIAPYIEDKHSDPAVVCVDSRGHHVVSVLSGHVGGANDLCRLVAAAIGATPVITTLSDLDDLWPLDTLASRYGWTVAAGTDTNKCIFAHTQHRPTALLLEVHDAGTDYLERSLPPHVTVVHDITEVSPDRFSLLIMVSPFNHCLPQGVQVLHYIPRVAVAGFGLAHHPADYREIPSQIAQAVSEAGISPEAIARWCTIDVKSDEPLVALMKAEGEDVTFYTAEQLDAVTVPTPSSVVASHVGTASVCEAAAILGSDYGPLVMTKRKGEHYTVAVAIDRQYARRQGGHIEIVGAGPGDPDLVSVRGRRLLEQADLILYAGSLVPRELTLCARAGAVVRSSADMNLDEQCQLMKEWYDRGALIVRLHTGDPCIFGAIQEQMAYFDRHHMHYHITPGISSFLAAAAELRSQFTIPGRTQTIILTRGEGRTPMPEREQLHLLARSQSTMCIFLSAAIVDEVQRQLLTAYPEDTPVAACYHLTWPDQRIYRGTLKDLARLVHDNHLTLTTMIVVGWAIDNRQGLSLLYDSHFTHLYRKGTE